MWRPALIPAVLLTLALSSCTSRSGGRGEASRSEPRTLPSGRATVNGPILSYADVVDQVAPAVVTIRSSQRVRAPQQFPFFNDPFFQQFFGGRVPRQGPRTEVEQSLGSGVIIRDDGYIITNYHVIDGAEQIRVDLSNHHTYSAKVVGSDPPSDLAVLKISANGLPVLHLGDSDLVRVGDVALAVGNPLAIGETVTAGIISAKGRATGLSNGSFEDFLQTDAPINKGNSGGALVNTRAELVGINSQILSPSGGNIGIGFAIPSNMARTVAEQLIGKGKVQRGMIGVTVEDVDSGIAQQYGLKQPRGVIVASVTPGSAGAKAGLKQGDIILQLNGKDIPDSNVFRNEIAATAPGTTVTLTVWRNNSEQKIAVRLGEWTAQAAQEEQGGGGGGAAGGKLGITVEPLTPELAAQLGLRRGTQGVVIDQVDPEGPAAEAGLQPGDVIQQVNRQPVRNAEDVRNALQKSGNRTPVLLINRQGQTLFISVGTQ